MIVAFSGYARSGKDTAAAVLVEEGGWTRLAFADILRKCVLALDPWVYPNNINTDDPMLMSEVIKKWGWDGYKGSFYSDDVRRLLQRMGTEVGRNILGDDIWVDATLRDCREGVNYVITDCRFPNEALAVKEINGRVFRITMPGLGPVNDHPSETSLDDWKFDGTIMNIQGRKEDFKEKVRRLFL